MYWQLCAAILLLLVWQDTSNQTQAARTNNLNVMEYWQPQAIKQTQPKSGSQSIVYPRYEFIQSRFPSGGYNRRRRLPGQGKAASTETTERPFIRVWNSFLRSVQPNFSLRNLTNPLVNLFNNGYTNVIESLPLEAEVHDEEQHDEDEEQLQYIQHFVETENANKRKRKRRKQQKRRPTFESEKQEQADDPYDYYGANTLAMQQLQHQPVYYFGGYDNYGMRRLHDYENNAQQHFAYYDPYYAGANAAGEQTSEEHFGKKITALQPLTLAFALPDVEENAANEEAADEEAANDDDIGESSDISESTRNVLGTYKRDDIQTRQRQRQRQHQIERQKSEVGGATDKTKTRRQQQRFIYLLRA